ncbi:UNKNOWN [Stylonychia lemnae]|uniref:Uncharacterized protein n=1 Tax=Stylonychia lemnae TaxID=5949 RepID=A0A078AER5_STYLE|nr:UNKNOWN [Stylonychia lemnae]|eukprot:CDW79982.1 UNKNOWN [Stylonychia lemnae]
MQSKQRRLSLNTLGSQGKTPARSSLDTSKVEIESNVDKSTELINLRNGYFTYQRQKSQNQKNSSDISTTSQHPNIIDKFQTTKNKQFTTFHRSPKISLAKSPTISGASQQPTQKTIKSSNQQTKAQSKPNSPKKENKISAKNNSSLFLNLSKIEANRDMKKSVINSYRQNESRVDVLLNQDLNSMGAKFKRNSFFEKVSGIDVSNNTMDHAMTERRRLNQTDVQSELLMIQQKQRQREQSLIEKFNQLKLQAQETFQTHQQQMLSQTQPMRGEEIDRRIQRFEQIIQTFIEKNPFNSDMMKTDYKLERNNSTQKFIDGLNLTNPVHNKSTFGGSGNPNHQNYGPSAQFNIVETVNKNGTLTMNQINQYSTSQQQHFNNSLLSPVQKYNYTTSQPKNSAQDEVNYVCSSDSTQDQRQVYQMQSSQVLDQTLPKSRSNVIINLKSSASQSIKKEDKTSPRALTSSEFNPSKHQVSQFQLNYSSNNPNPSQKDIQAFLETLQSLEESNNTTHLTQIRSKLVDYKEQIKNNDQRDNEQIKQQSQILKALDSIILKLDSQMNFKNTLTREQVDQEKISKQKYVILVGDNHNDNQALHDFDSLQTPSNLYNDHFSQMPTDNGDNVDVTNSSYIQSTRKQHMKNCNKSGYQVKHSRYRNDRLIAINFKGDSSPVDTYEEVQYQKGWLNEIKHIKTLLGGVASNNQSNEPNFTRNSVKNKDQDAASNQCIIM